MSFTQCVLEALVVKWLLNSYVKRKGVSERQPEQFLGWQPTHPPILLANDCTSVQLQK